MTSRKARHLTLRAIVKGSPLYGADPALNAVDVELCELGNCGRTQPLNRQRLLQVFHASRALDTSLGVILRSHSIAPKHGIGKMLHQLPSIPPTQRGHLPASSVQNYVSTIANPRNRYAHKAGVFPTSTQEVDQIVSEIHACLSAIL
jgi:hypothetical protein